jgi:hypothetical protein
MDLESFRWEGLESVGGGGLLRGDVFVRLLSLYVRRGRHWRPTSEIHTPTQHIHRFLPTPHTPVTTP